MTKISYDEFRPGHWVKKVDGQVVGPATAAEVAAWKREKAAPARIWEDVIATASRPLLDEVKVATSPAVKPEAPAEPGPLEQSHQSTLWEDLVKRTTPAVQAEGPSTTRPRKDDTDWAEQAQIWRDVVKRAKKPGPQPERQPAQGAPISPTTAEAKPRTASRASRVLAAAPKSTHPTPAAKPADEGTSTKKAFAAEIAARKPASKAVEPAAEVKAEKEAAPISKAPDAKPASKPTPPASPAHDAGWSTELTAKAEGKPRRGRVPKVPAAKVTAQTPVAKAAKKAKAAGKAASARKTVAPSERRKTATKDRLPAKLLDEIAGEEDRPATAPVEKAVTAGGQDKVSRSGRGKVSRSGRGKVSRPGRGTVSRSGRGRVPLHSGRASAGPKSSRAAASRRTAGKGKTAPAQERPNQLYLWISAGQADDLIAAVRTGLARYQERFSHVAEVVLCHSADLPTLEEAKLPVDLREGKSLAPRNFWIGSK
jgi:hypothetical protein